MRSKKSNFKILKKQNSYKNSFILCELNMYLNLNSSYIIQAKLITYLFDIIIR